MGYIEYYKEYLMGEQDLSKEFENLYKTLGLLEYYDFEKNVPTDFRTLLKSYNLMHYHDLKLRKKYLKTFLFHIIYKKILFIKFGHEKSLKKNL